MQPSNQLSGNTKPDKTVASGSSPKSNAAILNTLPVLALLNMLILRVFASARETISATCHSYVSVARTITARVTWKSNSGSTAQAMTLLRHFGQATVAILAKWCSQLSELSFGPRCAVILASILIAVPMAYLGYCIGTIPFARGPVVQVAPSAKLFLAEDGRPFATRGVLKGQNISPDHIPTLLADAVVAVEDRRFFEHGGIDLKAVTRAAWQDIAGNSIQGGSTITQQLARRLYLSSERTVKRKVQEAVLAEWLELWFSKKEILARYLNATYFGAGAYGANSAALRYFDNTAEQLSLSEVAMLAGLIKAPSELAPDRNLAGAQQRAGLVLDAMVDNGAITAQQAEIARQKPAVVHAASSPAGINYFLDAAAAEIKSQVGVGTEDLTVQTTFNPELQRIAENVIARRLASAGRGKNAHQAALVAMAPDGAVLAMVGGRDYNDSQFNRVTQARRQPGSAFKAVVYLSALRKGYTPDSVVVDQPLSVGNWEPENYGDRYFGPVTLRTAFARSLNSVAVQLAQSVGTSTVIDTAKQLGVRSELPAVPSVALGSGSVSPLEMTRAFAAIATNTTKFDSYLVRAITKDSQTVYARQTPAITLTDNPVVHAQMMDLLSSVVRDGTGKAARLGQPAAGKTGTSENYRDAWFVGFTSNLVVGVWVGNDDNSPMDGVVGGSLPAMIWHDFVATAESVRRPQSVGKTGMSRAASTPTINFDVAPGSDDGVSIKDYDRYREYGHHRLFGLFRFRF